MASDRRPEKSKGRTGAGWMAPSEGASLHSKPIPGKLIGGSLGKVGRVSLQQAKALTGKLLGNLASVLATRRLVVEGQ